MVNKRPPFDLSGWNGKIYGNDFFGYRIYKNGNGITISYTEKEELIEYIDSKNIDVNTIGGIYSLITNDIVNKVRNDIRDESDLDKLTNEILIRYLNVKEIEGVSTEIKTDYINMMDDNYLTDIIQLVIDKIENENVSKRVIEKYGSGMWNGKVYGKEGNYTIYLNNRKIEISDKDAELLK